MVVVGLLGGGEMVGANNDLRWRTSSRACEAGSCVEVAVTEERVLLRKSTDPEGPRLDFSRSAWSDFIAAVRADEMDFPTTSAPTTGTARAGREGAPRG
jgi:hypothetical protein